MVIKTPDDFGDLLSRFDFSIPKELHSFEEEDLDEIEAMITQALD